jgi:hypothetical protein
VHAVVARDFRVPIVLRLLKAPLDIVGDPGVEDARRARHDAQVELAHRETRSFALLGMTNREEI